MKLTDLLIYLHKRKVVVSLQNSYRQQKRDDPPNTSRVISAITHVSVTRIDNNVIDEYVNALCITQNFACTCYILLDFRYQWEGNVFYFFRNFCQFYYEILYNVRSYKNETTSHSRTRSLQHRRYFMQGNISLCTLKIFIYLLQICTLSYKVYRENLKTLIYCVHYV